MSKMFSAALSHRAGGWLVILGALFMVSVFVACSDATPSASPTATAPAPPAASVAPLSTPSPTSVPSTPTTEALLTATVAPQPSPVPAVVHTSPPVPTASPTAEPAALDELAAASEEVFGLVEELVAELGHREGGTPEELQAAERLKERLEAMGYDPVMQSFAFERFDLMRWVQTRGENAVVIVESPVNMPIPGLLLTSTPAGGMDSGLLTPVEPDSQGDLPEDGLDGKVALLQPGTIQLDDPQALQTLQDQVNGLASAGAIAAVISGEFAGLQGYRPLATVESLIPAMLVSKEFGGSPADLLAQGEVILSVKIDTLELESQNVVAELKGESEDVVVVGAHYDIVPPTMAGANDNTSGTAVVLALADALSGRSLAFTVRFIAFGAEELGLYGSRNYVSALGDAELDRVKAMMNLDTVGTGAWLGVAGNDEWMALALEMAEGLGVEARISPLPPGASSDHKSFEDAGVPVLIIYASDVSRIHTPNDSLEFVQPEALGSTFLIAKALLQSPDFAQ